MRKPLFEPVFTKRLTALLMLAASATVAVAADATLNIEAGTPVAKVNPHLYGLMTEEINHSYDGGLYAELVQNRAFMDNKSQPVHWSLVADKGATARMELDTNQPLSGKLPVSLRLEATAVPAGQRAGIANEGYWGIPVEPNTKYRASFYAKTLANYAGPVTVSIEGDDGRTICAQAKVKGLTTEWQQFEVTLKTGSVGPTTQAHLSLTVDQPGTVWFGLVSLFPPTWNDRPNGLRKDLMQMLVDLKPGFLRFPGGNFVEGDTVARRFDWKQTIGPLTNRPGHWGPWGYRSTDGMGLLEFLEWCEDMKAEPVLAVYAGYNLKHTRISAGPKLVPYVQDALDEIEYVTGSATSKWGAERARDGHPKPFALQYVEIGNEDWFDSGESYDARFSQFYDAIHMNYPALKLISTIGHEQAKKGMVHTRQPDLVDEHYYRPADEFLGDLSRNYESYARTGPRIFVGEWAAYETPFVPWDKRSASEPPTPNMKAALGDAAWMMDLERNADIVTLQCYAPLLVNVNPGARQWRPNLIGYDALHVYGSPSYYAIKMFSRNFGDETLAASLTNSLVQTSVTRSSRIGEIFIKLVNPAEAPQTITVNLKGVKTVSGKGRALTLAADPTDTNSIGQREKVVPVESKLEGVGPRFDYKLEPHSIVVLMIKAK